MPAASCGLLPRPLATAGTPISPTNASRCSATLLLLLLLLLRLERISPPRTGWVQRSSE